MPVSLKKINEQVIVITGATSGVGLVTARQAAQRGARLVLAARNEPALKQLAAELTGRGTEVVHVVADVGDDAQVRAIAQAAIAALRRLRHVDQQRRRVDLRAHRGHSARRPEAPVRHQLLGRRQRLAASPSNT